MLCQRCQSAWLGPDGRCPGCDADPWRAPAARQPPQQPPGQPPPCGTPPDAGTPGYGTPPPYPTAAAPHDGPPSPYGTQASAQQPCPTAPPHGYGYPAVQPTPYAPPPVPHSGFAAPPRTARPVRVPSGLATALYVLLGLSVIADMLALVASALEFSYFGRLEITPWDADPAEADAVDAFYGITAVGGLLLYLATGVVFIIWFHRVRLNAEPLGSGWPQRFSPGWAIGSWFIPLANLWIPMRIAVDVWNASDPGARHGGPSPAWPGGGGPRGPAGGVGGAGLVLCWWLAWVGGYLLSGLTRAMDTTTEVTDYGGMQAVYAVEMAGLVVGVAAGVLAILVVRRITTMQGVHQALGGAGGQTPGAGGFPGPGQAPGQGTAWGYPG